MQVRASFFPEAGMPAQIDDESRRFLGSALTRVEFLDPGAEAFVFTFG